MALEQNMDKQIRYLPDDTGVNPSNAVHNETHRLGKAVKNRVIVPLHGSFYAESVSVWDVTTNLPLVRGKDFTFAGLRTVHTRMTSQAVYALIVVTNPDVSSSVKIKYQNTGETDNVMAHTLVDLLDQPFVDEGRIPLSKIINLPKEFPTTFHYHDLGDIDRMDYLLFCLERIRLSLLNDNQGLFVYLGKFERIIEQIAVVANNEFDFEIYRIMSTYTLEVMRAGLNIDRLVNHGLLTAEEGAAIARNEMLSVIPTSKEGYLSLLVLADYSRQLMELYTNSDQTTLGTTKVNVMDPTVANFTRQAIGSTFTIIDYTYAVLRKVPDLDIFYPDRVDRRNEYLVRKISHHTDDHVSIFLYIGKSTPNTYVMRLFQVAGVWQSKFSKIMSRLDMESITHETNLHYLNYDNPHIDDKRDIKLSQVENLPVVSRSDIQCNMPVRKYVTVDNLLFYMRRFKTGNTDPLAIHEQYSPKTITKQMQTLFSPCGAWESNVDFYAIDVCQQYDVVYEVDALPPLTTTGRPLTSTTTTVEPTTTTEEPTTEPPVTDPPTTSTTTTTTLPPSTGGYDDSFDFNFTINQTTITPGNFIDVDVHISDLLPREMSWFVMDEFGTRYTDTTGWPDSPSVAENGLAEISFRIMPGNAMLDDRTKFKLVVNIRNGPNDGYGTVKESEWLTKT